MKTQKLVGFLVAIALLVISGNIVWVKVSASELKAATEEAGAPNSISTIKWPFSQKVNLDDEPGEGTGAEPVVTPTPPPDVPPSSSSADGPAPAAIDAAPLYSASCSACHGADRQGGLGPALTAQALGDKDSTALANTIANGKPPMPGFSSALNPDQISALVAWLKSTP